MTILKCCSRDGDQYWLANTPEQLVAAEGKAFQMLDGLDCFADDNATEVSKARAGDIWAIHRLLERLEGLDVDGWYFVEVG